MTVGRVHLSPDEPFLGYDCPECGNRGILVWSTSGGEMRAIVCACMEKRKMNKAAGSAGIGSRIDNQTRDTFVAEKAWQTSMKRESAKYLREYAKDKRRKWFYLGGSPGTGKTHLCTAIVGELMKSGFQAKYMIWRDEVGKLKRLANDPEYDILIREFKTVPVLYIDDFLKTASGTLPTDADIQVAFEVVNARYNNPDAITIFSSERRPEDITALDQGLGGRIIERSKPFTLSVYPGHDVRTSRN